MHVAHQSETCQKSFFFLYTKVHENKRTKLIIIGKHYSVRIQKGKDIMLTENKTRRFSTKLHSIAEECYYAVFHSDVHKARKWLTSARIS